MLGFLCHFGLKMGIHFAYFGLESGMVFEGTTGVYECIYRFNSKWVTKKEKYANSKWILRNRFCCCSNLSNNDIISQRPGLNKGVKSGIFLPEIVSGFGEPGSTPSEMPTSGDLKSGDCLFFTTPRNSNDPPPPPRPRKIDQPPMGMT